MGVPSRLGDRLVGHTYQLVGVQSGKNLSATASGDSALSIADTPETLTDTKKQAWKFTQIDQSDTERPGLKAYVITNTDCKVLVAKDGTNAFSDESVEDAKSDPAARWIFDTSDGATYQLLNASAKQNINVDAFDPKAGSCGSMINLFSLPYNHQPELVSGVMEEQCADELRTFFRELREKRKLIRKAQKSEKAAAESGESQQDAFCEREK